MRSRSMLATALVLSSLAGCDAPPATGPTLPETSVATSVPPTVDPAEEEARRRIIARYNSFLEAYVKASATADYHTTELAHHVGEPLLGRLVNDLYTMSRNGMHYEGRPTWTVEVTELRLSAGEGVLRVCLDSTNWKAVGVRSPVPQSRHYPLTVRAKLVTGKWYVYESTAHRGDTC